MAKKFKDYYDIDTAKLIADKIKKVFSEFDSAGFADRISQQIVDKEFLQRQDVYAEAFEEYLGNNYSHNVEIFSLILGDELQTTEGMFTYGWWLWPIGRYIERRGPEDFELSMNFIYELTKRFTGEFAVRPLLIQNPKKTLKFILKWSKDKNVHVRRLASEGIRISLPWAKKTLAGVNEFEIYKEILTNLKNSPEKFVQKSVGNNLNDLMKEDPVKAKEIIDLWRAQSPTKETLWIIKHGLRSVKNKDTI